MRTAIRLSAVIEQQRRLLQELESLRTTAQAEGDEESAQKGDNLGVLTSRQSDELSQDTLAKLAGVAAELVSSYATAKALPITTPPVPPKPLSDPLCSISEKAHGIMDALKELHFESQALDNPLIAAVTDSEGRSSKKPERHKKEKKPKKFARSKTAPHSDFAFSRSVSSDSPDPPDSSPTNSPQVIVPPRVLEDEDSFGFNVRPNPRTRSHNRDTSRVKSPLHLPSGRQSAPDVRQLMTTADQLDLLRKEIVATVDHAKESIEDLYEQDEEETPPAVIAVYSSLSSSDLRVDDDESVVSSSTDPPIIINPNPVHDLESFREPPSPPLPPDAPEVSFRSLEQFHAGPPPPPVLRPPSEPTNSLLNDQVTFVDSTIARPRKTGNHRSKSELRDVPNAFHTPPAVSTYPEQPRPSYPYQQYAVPWVRSTTPSRIPNVQTDDFRPQTVPLVGRSPSPLVHRKKPSDPSWPMEPQYLASSVPAAPRIQSQSKNSTLMRLPSSNRDNTKPIEMRRDIAASPNSFPSNHTVSPLYPSQPPQPIYSGPRLELHQRHQKDEVKWRTKTNGVTETYKSSAINLPQESGQTLKAAISHNSGLPIGSMKVPTSPLEEIKTPTSQFNGSALQPSVPPSHYPDNSIQTSKPSNQQSVLPPPTYHQALQPYYNSPQPSKPLTTSSYHPSRNGLQPSGSVTPPYLSRNTKQLSDPSYNSRSALPGPSRDLGAVPTTGSPLQIPMETLSTNISRIPTDPPLPRSMVHNSQLLGSVVQPLPPQAFQQIVSGPSDPHPTENFKKARPEASHVGGPFSSSLIAPDAPPTQSRVPRISSPVLHPSTFTAHSLEPSILTKSSDEVLKHVPSTYFPSNPEKLHNFNSVPWEVKPSREAPRRTPANAFAPTGDVQSFIAPQPSKPTELPPPMSKPQNVVAAPSVRTPIAAFVSLEGCKAVPAGTVLPPHVNQDRGFIVEISPKFSAFGVFDGHGENGHLVSEFISNTFKKLIRGSFPPSSRSPSEDPYASYSDKKILHWLKSAFKKAHLALTQESGICCDFSGCTASVALRHNDTVCVAYVGDSKVVGFQFQGGRAVRVLETPEHNPAALGESARIRECGGRISEIHFEHLNKTVSRIVEAGLSVSRSFGDLEARRYGLICVPEFVKFELNSNATPTVPKRRGTKAVSGARRRELDDEDDPNKGFSLMLVVASDGLWDTMKTREVLQFCSNFIRSKEVLMQTLRHMSEVAWHRRLQAEGRSDDTTTIIALF